MLPSCFSVSHQGATPQSSQLSLSQQIQYLSQVYPDLRRAYPLSLASGLLYGPSSCDPAAVSLVTMANPDVGDSSPRPSPQLAQSFLQYSDSFPSHSLVGASGGEMEDYEDQRWEDSDKESALQQPHDGAANATNASVAVAAHYDEADEEDDNEIDDEGEEEEREDDDDADNGPGIGSHRVRQEAPGAMPAATIQEARPQAPYCPPSASAVKFSIDSILGLSANQTTTNTTTNTTNASSNTSLSVPTYKASSHLSDAVVNRGPVQSVATTNNDYQPQGTSQRGHAKSLDQLGAAQRHGAVVSDDGSDERAKDDPAADSDGKAGGAEEEQTNYPWLQCTRYHPPKLQRSKKKDGGGKKRKLGRNPRVPFTQHQVSVLEEKFRRTHYLSSMDVAELSTALTLSETRVKIWFQNRRARERREREASQRAQLLTQKPYQPLSIPSVTWALSSHLAPSPFSAQYRNELNFRAGLFSSAFSAFSTPARHERAGDVAKAAAAAACTWTDTHASDDDNFY